MMNPFSEGCLSSNRSYLRRYILTSLGLHYFNYNNTTKTFSSRTTILLTTQVTQFLRQKWSCIESSSFKGLNSLFNSKTGHISPKERYYCQIELFVTVFPTALAAFPTPLSSIVYFYFLPVALSTVFRYSCLTKNPFKKSYRLMLSACSSPLHAVGTSLASKLSSSYCAFDELCLPVM